MTKEEIIKEVQEFIEEAGSSVELSEFDKFNESYTADSILFFKTGDEHDVKDFGKEVAYEQVEWVSKQKESMLLDVVLVEKS